MRSTLVIFTLLLQQTCFSQLSMSYSMGGISLGPNSSSSFAGPLILTNDKSCLQISNGVIVFSSTARGSALFDPTCNTSVAPPGTVFSIAPNPSRGTTRLYATVNSISADDNFTIMLSSQTGQSMHKYYCKGAQLKNGFPIETNQLSAGVYLVTIYQISARSGGTPQSYSSTLKLINTHL